MDVLPPARMPGITARLAAASCASKLDSGKPHLLCFSHLRWSFVYQRPQHLISRAAGSYQVVFWEEPEYADAEALRISMARSGITVAVPVLPHGTNVEAGVRIQQRLLDSMINER